MPEFDGTEPIADDELLYRRLPVSMDWYDPARCPIISPKAFRPRSDDETGLSIFRGLPYNTIEQAAFGPSKQGYYVAVLRAGDLRVAGIEVVPKPVPGVSGHAEITTINGANRDSDEARVMIEMLAHKLCLRVEGPFTSQKP
jgi:hypothetical protein